MKELLTEFFAGLLGEAGEKKFKAKSKESGRIVPFSSQEAMDKAIKSGTHEPVEKAKVPKQTGTPKAKAPEKKTPTKKQPSAAAATVEKPTTKKNKTLRKVNTVKTEEFSREQKPNDAEFSKRNKKFQIGPPPPLFKLPSSLLQNPKIPKRHLKALERLINTRATAETAKWSHFSDIAGGAGKISAQAGELMTLISTTMDDKQADELFTALMEHESVQIKANPKLQKENTRIVTKSWIQAAKNNRKAIRKRIEREYPGAQIVAGAWDSEAEVTAMGLADYKKNKGFSTDAYFKIRTADGKEILDEVSLKKSTLVNFLNSGTTLFLDWDPNLPDNVNPKVYSKNQRQDLLNFGTKHRKELEKAVAGNKEFQAMMKSKKVTLEQALTLLAKGKGSRAVNKVVLTAIKIAAEKGSKSAKQYLVDVDKKHRQHQSDVIKALGSNRKLKQGMLGSIREEFPLKAVGEGEESMAIGPYSLDRAVLKAIFDTSNFEEIREGLFAVTDEDPPYLAYRAGKKGRVVPIATIVAREDGVGYGGQIKFEMQLDPRFAKILAAANKNVYGE